MIYYFTYFLTKILSFVYFPCTIKGWQNVPKEGSYILVSNHISNLDPVVMGISTPRRLHFMAKIELFKNPLMGWWLKQLWAFPIQRGKADFGALKVALNLLKDGYPVLLYPEGRRRIGDELIKPQTGVGFLALRSQVPIVPVFVKNSDIVMPPGSKRFKRAPVSVTYGKAFDVKDAPTYEAAAEKILQEIYKLDLN